MKTILLLATLLLNFSIVEYKVDNISFNFEDNRYTMNYFEDNNALYSLDDFKDEILSFDPQVYNEISQEISDINSIDISSQYYKITNVNTEIVSKEEAFKAAITLDNSFNDNSSDGGGNQLEAKADFEDAYLRISYKVYNLNNGIYRFITDATYLKMPINRKEELIGSTAMNLTVENDSRYSYIEYDEYEYISGNLFKINNIKKDLTNFQNVIEGIWYGSCARFDLPEDIKIKGDIDNDTIIKNFHSHFEYEGRVIYPEQEMYFNTSASYDHVQQKLLTFKPGISINVNKTISASISFDLKYFHDTWLVELNKTIHYNPNN